MRVICGILALLLVVAFFVSMIVWGRQIHAYDPWAPMLLCILMALGAATLVHLGFDRKPPERKC